jgi:hypothetical protein
MGNQIDSEKLMKMSAAVARRERAKESVQS